MKPNSRSNQNSLAKDKSDIQKLNRTPKDKKNSKSSIDSKKQKNEQLKNKASLTNKTDKGKDSKETTGKNLNKIKKTVVVSSEIEVADHGLEDVLSDESHDAAYL